MAKCSIPYIEKRFRESDPVLANKLNDIAYDTFDEISKSNLFNRQDNNFVFNEQGTEKRKEQNDFVSDINNKLGAEVVKDLENKVSVNVFTLVDNLRGVPKYVKNISTLITPATVRSYDDTTKRIQQLSLRYDKLIRDFSESRNETLFEEIKEIENQILDSTQKEIVESVSKIGGVSVRFEEPKIGLWDNFFEPSFNMTLAVSQRADSEELSKLLFDFAEKYSQDAFILEMESDLSKDVYEGRRLLPINENDEKGFTHYPQIVYTFGTDLNNLELSGLSSALQKNGIDAFSLNKNELKISVVPFLTETQLETLNEEEQYAEKLKKYEEIQLNSWRSTVSAISDTDRVEQEIRIRKSSYHGAKNEKSPDQTRIYDRSNILEKFQEVNTEEELLSQELSKLREKEILLQQDGKQLSKDEKDRFNELSQIVQPLVQNTFEVDEAFYNQAKKEVEELAKQSIKNFDASVSPFDIKKPQRASVKTLRWYSGFTEKLGDGARVNIIVNNDADADAIFDKINKDNPAEPGLRRINEVTNLQYPKRLIEVKSSDGIISEIQVITKEAYLAKDGLRGFTGGDKQVKEAKKTLKKIQDNLGWKIPDGLGHYFYEINRDVNVDENLKSVAFELSNLYYEAFTNPNSTLGEDFMNDVIAFKVKVDNADKTTWDEGNEGKAPVSLTQYIAENNINEEEVAANFLIEDFPTEETISPLTPQIDEQEEFKTSEELPESFLTLKDFEESIYPEVTMVETPERIPTTTPVAPKKTLNEEWDEYTALNKKENLTEDEQLILAPYKVKFDMFNSLSEYQKVMQNKSSKAFGTFRDKKLEELLQRFADNFGITIADIEEFQKQYFEKTGKFIPANGVANLIEKTIYVSEGNTDALTEEVAHFIIAMLPKDGELYQNLKQYISRTKEYELFYDKYLDQYEGDVDKTEEEIMGKVLKNALQDKTETVPFSVKSTIKSILNYFSSLFSNDRNNYLDSLSQIKTMFFAENLAQALDESNISYDELYQLNFEITGQNNSDFNLAKRKQTFDKGAEIIIQNLEDSLLNIRQQAFDTNQTRAINSSNYLLSVLKDDSEGGREKSDILKDVIYSSVGSIRRLKSDFMEFNKMNIPSQLAAEYSKEALMKMSYDEYNNSLKKLASAINYLQSLYSLAKSIENTTKAASFDKKDLFEFNKILKEIDPSLDDNNELLRAINLLNSDGVSTLVKQIEGVYLKNVRAILDIYMGAITTEDQKRFLDYTRTSYFSNIEESNTEDRSQNVQEWSTSVLNNIRNFFGKSITPVTMQNDEFIQSVDRFVWAMEQMGKEAASKDVAAAQRIENTINNNGGNPQNQSWLSAKDEKGNTTGNLLTRLSYTKYMKFAVENLQNTLDNLPSGIFNKISQLSKDKLNSPKQLFDKLNKMLEDKILTEDEYEYAKNYITAQKAYFDLEHVSPNYSETTLSNYHWSALQNFIDRKKQSILSALNNSSFDWASDEIDLIVDDMGDLQDALETMIAAKRSILEEKYYTFEPKDRDLDNPIFKSQFDYVEGLLNTYKYRIGYSVDEDGQFYPEKINIDIWGDEYLFELNNFHPNSDKYRDEEYAKLERDSANGDRLSQAKLDMINHISKWNKQNNLPSNFLPKGVKRDSEYLQVFGNKRFIRIFGIDFDVTKILSNLVLPMGGVAATPMIFGMGAGLVNPLTLGIGTLAFSYFFYQRMSEKIIQTTSIVIETYKRIDDVGTLKKLFLAIGKTLGLSKQLLNYELNKDDKLLATTAQGAPSEEGIKMWVKNAFHSLISLFNKKEALKQNKVDKIPYNYREFVEPALRSNQYLDNFKSFIYATKEYENKSLYEGSIRAMNDMYRKRVDNKGNSVGDDYLEAIYIDRYWYNKIYPNNLIMKSLRFLGQQTGFNQLTGNLNTGVKNIVTGISMIMSNGGLLSTMPAIAQATKYSLNMLFLSGKGSRVKMEQNKIQMIKKHLRSSSFGGSVDFDYSDSSLVQKLRLNNSQMASELGESFISSVIIYKFLNETKLIDENGKKVDIVKYLTIKEGRLALDDKAPKQIFFNNINDIQNAEDLNLDPEYAKDINLRNIVPKNLQKEALTPLELEVFLNRTLLQNIDYFRQRSQGVYNILLKPRVSTTALGSALFMYQHYVLPGLYTALGRKKNSPNLENSEEGFMITLAKGTGRLVSAPFREKLSPDSLENIMKINNINTKGLIEELGVLSRAFLKLSGKKGITDSLNKIAEEQAANPTYEGFQGKPKEDIFKELLLEANKQRRVYKHEADNYKKIASILAMYAILKALLKFAYPPLEENEMVKYMATVATVVKGEMFRTWFPFQEGRLGFSWNVDPMGRRANEAISIFDANRLNPYAGVVNDMAKSIYWAGQVGLYRMTGIEPFSGETQEKIMKATEGDIPLLKTKYFFNRKGYVIGEVNVTEDVLKDFFIGSRMRDAFQASPLREKKYLDMPSEELDLMIYKLERGYYSVYGKEIEAEIKEEGNEFFSQEGKE